MIIQIMSRADAVRYSKEIHNEASAFISISDFDGDCPKLLSGIGNGIFAQCTLKFDDVEYGKMNCITEYDAQKIVSFVTESAINADKLIVHCEAGVSRSAGVAGAIMKALYDNDWEVFSNPRYIPNMTCYRMVLSAFCAKH